MKDKLKKTLQEACTKLKIPFEVNLDSIQVQDNKNTEHGDFASNIALKFAKNNATSPIELANQICEQFEQLDWIEKTEIANPGFINFFITHSKKYAIINIILEEKENYGKGKQVNRKNLIEFVSANPTGPLHVGHGRGAVYGDSLTKLLHFSGIQADKEYYVNDAGRQIDILVISVIFRFIEFHQNKSLTHLFPEKAYQGDYINSLAKALLQEEVTLNIEEQENNRTNHLEPEKVLDYWIVYFKEQSQPSFSYIKQNVVKTIVEGIDTDLDLININFDHWFSEQQMVDDQSIVKTIAKLTELGKTYTKDNALWFKSTEYADNKDRVLIRGDGLNTYFANDIAYHANKFERGYDQVINIWGADHHGYIVRMKAAMQALGYDPTKLVIILVQFAALFRGEEKIAMSTRGGNFVSLNELIQEIGVDATRFYYNINTVDQHLNFDLNLAVEKNNENPVFYIQYAHARICSIFTRLQERNIEWQPAQSDNNLLTDELEDNLIKTLISFPEKIQIATSHFAPHQISLFLKELASQIHQYYNKSTILVEDNTLRNTRLNLLMASKIVFKNGLSILGVSAPEKM